MVNCSRCGGQMLAAGALHSPVRLSFRPQDTRFLTLQTGDVLTKAMMCRDCGVIEIVGDVNKLRHLTGDGVPEKTLERLERAERPTLEPVEKPSRERKAS